MNQEQKPPSKKQPVEVRKVGEKYRIVEAGTDTPAKNSRTGSLLDGGGHDDQDKARRQAGYINGTAPSRNP